MKEDNALHTLLIISDYFTKSSKAKLSNQPDVSPDLLKSMHATLSSIETKFVIYHKAEPLVTGIRELTNSRTIRNMIPQRASRLYGV